MTLPQPPTGLDLDSLATRAAHYNGLGREDSADLIGEVRRLRDLVKYVRHGGPYGSPICEAMKSESSACTCGLAQAVDRWQKGGV